MSASGLISFSPPESPASQSYNLSGGSTWVGDQELRKRVGEYYASLHFNNPMFRYYSMLVFGSPFMPEKVQNTGRRLFVSLIGMTVLPLIRVIPWPEKVIEVSEKYERVCIEYYETTGVAK